MEVKVDWDELYPYYFLTGNSSDYYERIVEITEEELAFIRKANSDFFAAQDILKSKIHPNGR